MDNRNGKIVIIGSGYVGASTAFSIAAANIASQIYLVDVDRNRAEGEALDLNHGLPFLGQMRIESADYDVCKGADVIVITAGANRKPGETRLDLAKKNVGIMRSIINDMMPYYDGAVVVVVANPVDVLTYMIHKETNIPKNKIISSGTWLDTSRMRYTLSDKANIDVRNIHSYILGEHGDSSVPIWSCANVAGVDLVDYFKSHNIDLDKDEIYNTVQSSGATVIKYKGATYYGIALSVTRICEAILLDQNSVLTVGTLCCGEYGIEDVVISLPCIVNSEGVQGVVNLPLAENELESLHASANKLKTFIADVL